MVVALYVPYVFLLGNVTSKHYLIQLELVNESELLVIRLTYHIARLIKGDAAYKCPHKNNWDWSICIIDFHCCNMKKLLSM